MPPRTRKAAASAPDLETKPDGGEAPAAEPIAFGDGAPELVVPADSAAQPAETETTQPATATETLTYHWRHADGPPGSPCRLCAPAGPPTGAGSFGCGHGQWVLVAGDA